MQKRRHFEAMPVSAALTGIFLRQISLLRMLNKRRQLYFQ
ncbi:hypothetical protein [Polaromonas sp. CG9_12]|nr:hypothetical protein [Polaromonas sp. CG9_12]